MVVVCTATAVCFFAVGIVNAGRGHGGEAIGCYAFAVAMVAHARLYKER